MPRLRIATLRPRDTRGASRIALALLYLLGSSPAARAEMVLTDVAASVQLDFVNEYGPHFSELAELPDQVFITLQRNTGNGAAVGDYDDDGDLDVYVVGNIGVSNRLYRNEVIDGVPSDAKLFTDVTESAFGLAEDESHDLGLSRTAAFVDLDNDGDLDLVVLSDDNGENDPDDPDYSRSGVFENLGDGTFADRSASSGFRPVGYLRAGLAIGDYDGDGRLDLYATVWTATGAGSMPFYAGSNRLYRNLGDFVFEDVTEDAGLGGLARDSFSAVFHDFDGDHDADLYVAVDHSSDEFYFNDGGVFTNGTQSTGLTHVGNDMGIACADFDDDDDIDLYVTNITEDPSDTGVEQGNVLSVNQSSETGFLTFEDRATAHGVFHTYWGWGTQFVDFENDGDLDLIAANGFDEFAEIENPDNPGLNSLYYDQPTVLFENDGSGSFSRVLRTGLDTPSDGRGLIAFDFDRDGDRDVLITSMDARVQLFENESPPEGATFLDVVLSPDRYAMGATVRATVLGASPEDDVTRRRDVVPGRSYLSGTPSEVHFGLDGAMRVQTLEIEWSDGETQVFNDVAANQILRVERVPEPGRAAALVALATLCALRRHPRSASAR